MCEDPCAPSAPNTVNSGVPTEIGYAPATPLGDPIRKLHMNFFSARLLAFDPEIQFSKCVKTTFCLSWVQVIWKSISWIIFFFSHQRWQKQIWGKQFKSPLPWLVLNIFSLHYIASLPKAEVCVKGKQKRGQIQYRKELLYNELRCLAIKFHFSYDSRYPDLLSSK